LIPTSVCFRGLSPVNDTFRRCVVIASMPTDKAKLRALLTYLCIIHCNDEIERGIPPVHYLIVPVLHEGTLLCM